MSELSGVVVVDTPQLPSKAPYTRRFEDSVGGACESAAAAQVAALTERELDVLRLIGRGATNTEIGQELYISEGTVKTHVGRIFSKLGLRDRAAAVVFTFDHGLVHPGS